MCVGKLNVCMHAASVAHALCLARWGRANVSAHGRHTADEKASDEADHVLQRSFLSANCKE